MEEYQCVKCGYAVKGTLNVVNEARREHERETCPYRTDFWKPVTEHNWKFNTTHDPWVTSTWPVPYG